MTQDPSGAEPWIPELSKVHPPVGAGEGSVPPAVQEDLRALRAVVEGTARGTGEEFFQSLVRHLAEAIDVHYGFVAEFAGVPTRVRTRAFWASDRIVENVEYDLAGTPCEDVVRGGLCHHATGVKERFPQDKVLAEMGIESYLGVPLLDGDGNVLGHLAVLDERPMPAEPRRLFLFRIFAARATAELERLRADQRLRESEQRYRDFYDNAPNAYVSVGTDRRLLSVNRRASEMLGYAVEELLGRNVGSLLADTPDGEPRGAEIFRKFLAGEEAYGAKLEMRRKDGSPLWVSVWVKPLRGPNGQVQASRSIWVDITAQVLAEAARATAERARLRAEQQLQESEWRYRDLYENAPNAYLSVGVDGRLLRVNRRATELLGYAVDELVGMPVFAFMAETPAGKPRGAEVFRKFLAGEGVGGWDLEMRRKDGRPLWISLWMEPVRGEDGQVQASRSFWVDITDRVLAEAERAHLEQQNVYLQEEIKAAHNFEQIIGRSTALLEVLGHVAHVAPTDASVLIGGETGTGKELIARAVHSASKRRDKPLIKVNCAALPAGLVESELFGHEKGAFSGAITKRLGRFELADGGTLFLDEIGELSPEVQAKLLRVLQEREFDRVGGTAPIRVDVRVIAATNRDLLKAVREKAFREDLYYRLNVFPINLPPLRERPEDIPLLVHFLMTKFTTQIGKHLDGVSRPTMRRLQEYPWPGNIRELENVLERAVILATGAVLEIGPDLLPTLGPAPDAPLPAPETAERTPAPTSPPARTGQQADLAAVERDYIVTVLRQTDWVITGERLVSW